MASYRQLLRDPRWQRRRLEIFQRDDWTCQRCGSMKRELHVHHQWYISGAAPWEVAGEGLLTLCARCHEEMTMSQRIMTADGPLDPVPILSARQDRRIDVHQLSSAQGDNGVGYWNIETVEAITAQILAERHEPMTTFAGYVTYIKEGQDARNVWNKKLGAKRTQHVHFTTDQVGYEGTWGIDDLVQAYA